MGDDQQPSEVNAVVGLENQRSVAGRMDLAQSYAGLNPRLTHQTRMT